MIRAAFALVLAATPAPVTRAPFGTGADGAQVELITLSNAHGLTVGVSTRGGAIVRLLAPDRDGRYANVLLGQPDFSPWDKAGAFNTVVGRYANRIGGGGFRLDGPFHPLAGANAAGVVLHGGPNGFASHLRHAETFARIGTRGVVLSYHSADGENGFPGALDVTMTYTLTDADVLRIDYAAVTSRPTVVNLTNHSYWTLGGHASGPVDDQLLELYASRYTPTDAHQLPTGELRAVAGTPFDFRRPTRLRERVGDADPQMAIERGLDHNFALDGSPRADGLRVAARLIHPASGRQLEVRTTEPGMQVYTAGHMNGTQPGEGGRSLNRGDGIAFETQHFPDSPNRPAFPSTVLRPGERYRSTTEYALSTDRRPW